MTDVNEQKETKTEAWFKGTQATHMLMDDLREEIEAFNHRLSDAEIRSLYLVILIRVKDCLLDCGMEN